MSVSGDKYLTGPTKRRLDIIGGLALATLMLPPGVVAAAVGCVNSRSLDPFFRQTRIGSGGEPIDILKFRSLPKSRTEGTELQTFGTDDPRATKFGRLIRKLGFDEIPQLWGVIKGDLSLVGPRSKVDKDKEKLESLNPWLASRARENGEIMKDGLTGLEQLYRHINGNSNEAYEASHYLNDVYREKASLATDLRILGATPVKLMCATIGINLPENIGLGNLAMSDIIAEPSTQLYD